MNKTVLSKLMKEYDESPSVSEIGGASIKKFVLFKMEHFSDLVKIIKKKENSYVTYANDLIKSGYTPEYLSCMMKRCGGKSAYEVVSSKFANEMNIPTSYSERFDYEGIEYLLSIDFLKGKEEIIDLFNYNGIDYYQISKEFNVEKTKDYTMLAWERVLDQLLNQVLKGKSINEIKANKEKLIEDFAKILYFKKFIIKDPDFSRNIAFIYDGDNLCVAPVFDCEYAFWGDKTRCYSEKTEHELNDFFGYMYTRYPDVLHELIKNTKRLKKSVSNIISENFEDKFIAKDIINFCQNRCDFINQVYTNFDKAM